VNLFSIFKNLYAKNVTFFALLPQFSILYSTIGFSLNLISIPILFISLILIPLKYSQFTFNFNLRAFLFIIFGGIIYIYESKGGLIIILSLLVYTYVFINKSYNNWGFYDIFKSQLKVLLFISLVSFLFFILNLSNPFPFSMEGRGIMYVHYFFLSDFPTFEIFDPNSWRFYAFFNEPGAAAALSGTIIVKENFSIKRNLIFWITILASFSSGIFVALFITFIYLNFKKDYIVFIFIFSITLILFYFLGDNSPIFFVSYLHQKVFYFTYDFFSYKDDRLQYSFLHYIYESPIFFIFYLLLIYFIPSRFRIFFLVMGLYRHHFIINSLPVLIIILFAPIKVNKRYSVSC
jgi:hypothetical protein